jgi:hypothetical protein
MKATPQRTAQAASALPDEYLACRENHLWRLYYVKRVKGGRDRSWFCPRCKTEKHQFTDNEGYLFAPSYSYPKGYQITGMGRISGAARAAIRIEMLERMDDFEIDISELEGAL